MSYADIKAPDHIYDALKGNGSTDTKRCVENTRHPLELTICTPHEETNFQHFPLHLIIKQQN
uniref:Uncharacterized protein n=1 Tax=Anguilla anguilla TaxID=7936 RepID=A0A0E9PTD7_ANGAN